jgi:hypothetical protein
MFSLNFIFRLLQFGAVATKSRLSLRPNAHAIYSKPITISLTFYSDLCLNRYNRTDKPNNLITLILVVSAHATSSSRTLESQTDEQIANHLPNEI